MKSYREVFISNLNTHNITCNRAHIKGVVEVVCKVVQARVIRVFWDSPTPLVISLEREKERGEEKTNGS